MTNLTKYDIETVLNHNTEDQTTTVYTSRDKSVVRKLDRLVADYPDKRR